MKDWKFYAYYVKMHPPYRLSKDPDATPARRKKAKKFKRKWGFDYGEIWNLDNALACYLLPRIAYLRDNHVGSPTLPEDLNEDGTELKNEDEVHDRWNKELDTMCEGLYLYISKDVLKGEDKEIWEKAKELLFKRFEALWD